MNIHIDPSLADIVPTFKIGVISYHNIVIGESPQMLKGRLHFFQETLQVDLETKPLSDLIGVAQWRDIFTQLEIDPNKHQPSNERLYRKIKEGKFLPLVSSAIDLTSFFSLQYGIPIGLYNQSVLEGDITLRLGHEGETYTGINGEKCTLTRKPVSSDSIGAFGSPIMDSARARVTIDTTSALHLFYIRPSMEKEEAEQLLYSAGNMFTQIHGGSFNSFVKTGL